MEKKIREIIMPLAETLCKRLGERLEKAQQDGTPMSLFWMEQIVWVLLSA